MTPKELQLEAIAYFQNQGIDPNQPPDETSSFSPPAALPSPLDSGIDVKKYPCTISIMTVGFWTYVTVEYTLADKHRWKFKGGWGGGIDDLPSSVGLIVYGYAQKLHEAEDFLVIFSADDGGTVTVAWDSLGVAAATGVGGAIGTFHGKGRWERVPNTDAL